MSTEALEQAVAAAQAEVAQADAKVAADEALLAADKDADTAAHAKLDAATTELEQAKAAEAAEAAANVDPALDVAPTPVPEHTENPLVEIFDEMVAEANQIGGEVANRFLELIAHARQIITGS